MGNTGLTEFRALRPATDLGVSAAFNTQWIPIRGCKQFSFFLRATNGVALTSLDIQVRRRNSGAKGIYGATGHGLFTDLAIGAMNNPGLLVNVYPDPATGMDNVPMWDEARMVMVGNGASIITGLIVESQIIDDNVAVQNYDDPTSSNVST